MSRPPVATKAFTIIELVIVLAALGLIVGITAPRFVGSSNAARTTSAARGIVDALTAQRAETIRAMSPSRCFLVSGRSGPEAVRLVITDLGSAIGTTLESMLTEQGKVSEPFTLKGVWEGVRLAEVVEAGRNPAVDPGKLLVRTVLFEPSGRARLGNGDSAFALVPSQGGGTIRRIEFDPISGIPAVRSD